MITMIMAALAALVGGYLVHRFRHRKRSDKLQLPLPFGMNPYEVGTDIVDAEGCKEVLALGEVLERSLGTDMRAEDAATAVTGTSAKVAAIATRVEATSTYVYISRVQIGTEKTNSLVPTNTLDVEKMRGVSDLTNILPSQYGLDDDIFDAKLATNALLMHQFKDVRPVFEERREVPKKTIIVVQDVSGSMKKALRRIWSIGINVALIGKAQVHRIDYILVTFNGAVQSLRHVHDGDIREYSALARCLPKLIGSDGGTDINLALNYAIDYVAGLNNQPEEMSETVTATSGKPVHDFEMVLVTDGTETVSSDELLKRMKENRVALHTICVGEENPHLIQISGKYDYIRDVTST